MPEKDVYQIVADLRSKRDKSGLSNLLNTPSNLTLSEVIGYQKPTKTAEGTPIVRPVEYNVNPFAIYDRLSDGTYIPKYENIQGQVGNEERLAQEQSLGQKVARGFEKFAIKSVGNAIDNIVGNAYGLYKSATTGDFDYLWDNEFQDKFDDFNKKTNNNLAHYYTQEEKDAGFVKSLTSANFWFNDVGDGLAFVAGAMLPEIALGAVTGGLSLGVGLGKVSAGLGGRVAKEATEIAFKRSTDLADNTGLLGKVSKATDKILDKTNYTQGRDFVRSYNRAIYGKKAGDAISTAGFLFRTSNFEASMEARHSFNSSIDAFANDFEKKNGRAATYEEYKGFIDDARKSANALYGANLAILGVSNAAMFGKAFGLELPKIGKQTQNLFNRPLGLATKTVEGGEIVMRGANKVQKFTGNAYKILSKPVVEGVYEEGFQGVAGKTMQNYLESKYDPNAVEGYTVWSGLHDAFAEQYGTKEGWKEMGIGLIIGFAGGAIQPRQRNADGTKQSILSNIPGLGSNSRKSREAEIQGEIQTANSGITTLRNLDRASSIKNFRNVAQNIKDGSYQSVAAENAKENVTFIQSQEHLKSPSEIKKDYDAVIDNMQLDNEQIEELVSARPDLAYDEATGTHSAVTEYKQALKNEFAQNLKDYRFATKAVEALGLDRDIKISSDTKGDGKLTKGNVVNLKDAFVMNIMLGKSSLKSAQEVSDQLDKLLGKTTLNEQGIPIRMGGVFDVLQFYNSLTQEQKNKVEELKVKQARLEDLKRLSLEFAQRPPRKLKSGETVNKYEETAEKAVITQQQIIKLNQEIETIKTSLDNSNTANSYDLDGTLTNSSVDVMTTIEELDKLDDYRQALRASGKNQEADSINYLVNQFKFFSDSHREMMNAHRAMMSSGFFQSKAGSKLIDRIIGKRYKMSDSFRQEIRDNNDKIDASLNLVGISAEENTVEEIIEDAIENNDELSDREKFRLESILRLQLGLQRTAEQVKNITESFSEINSEKLTNQDPLDGDTVRLRESIKNRDLNNIEVLTNTINDILSQLDAFIITKGLTAEKRTEIEKELENLKTQLKTIQDATQNNQQQKQENPEQSDISKYSGIDGGQQEGGQSEGSQRETTQQSSDIGNSDIRSQEEKEITDKISSIEDELANTNIGVTYISSPEYRRLTDLMKKKENDTITPQEQIELDELENDVDQWLMISGTVADGIRLSDLIRQKIILEETEVTPLEEIREVSVDEVLENTDFSEKTGQLYYDIAQSPDKVTAVKDGDFIVVSGMTAQAFTELAGVEVNFETEEKIAKIGGSQQNNLLLTKDEVQRINEAGNLSILATNKDMTTNYSVVYQFVPKIGSEEETGKPLDSNHNDFAEQMNTDAIYEAVEGDVVTLEIDPNDPWNKKLISEYKGTEDEETIEDLLEDEDLSGLSEDDLEVKRAEDLERIAENDEETISLKKEEARILAILNSKESTIDAKNKARKDKEKVFSALYKRENKIADDYDKAIKKKLKPRTVKKKTKSAPTLSKEELKRSLVIRVKDKNGNFVGVLKAKRSSKQKEAKDNQFDNFRDAIVNDDRNLNTLLNNSTVTLADQVVTVKKVLIGHPNFNIVKGENGTTAVRYKQISDQDVSKIVDIGFVEDGTMNTKSKIKGVDTTFLDSAIKATKKVKGEKVPFIVFEKAGKRIAYPVKLIPKEKVSTEEFRTVFNSTAEDIEKVARLNKMLADRGIDITQPGNAFISFGNSNMTSEFLEEKIAQVEAIDDYAPLSEWINEDDNMQDILKFQVLLNIDLSNPLHSPKLQLDYSQVFENLKPEAVSEVIEEDLDVEDDSAKTSKDENKSDNIDEFIRAKNSKKCS